MIDEIIAEVERLYLDKQDYSEDRWDMGYDMACEDILNYLYGLKDQKEEKNDIRC